MKRDPITFSSSTEVIAKPPNKIPYRPPEKIPPPNNLGAMKVWWDGPQSAFRAKKGYFIDQYV